MQGKDISMYGRPKLAQKGLTYDMNTSKYLLLQAESIIILVSTENTVVY